MSARFFLDSNVFIYSFDSTAPGKARRAADLIREAHSSHKGVVSFQVIQEFFNFALRRSVPPMTAADAGIYLSTVFQPLPTIQSSLELYRQALSIHDRHRISWYDALIVAAAVSADCPVLFSEDLQDGQKFEQTRVRNPFR